MTRDAKNREKDQKISKLMKNNDFFRFLSFRAMTLTVPRSPNGDANDLIPPPENENAGMLAHPDVDVMWKAEAHQH